MAHSTFAPALPGLYVLLGAAGSGKSEFALNLVLSFAQRGAMAALADLDVVKPYFRSRSQQDMLIRHGVRLVAPPGALRDSDLPVIPAEALALLADFDCSAVLDVGGGSAGARVLGAFGPHIARRMPAVYYVLNCSRRDNATARRAVDSIAQVAEVSGLAVNGIVHNTHLLDHTTPDIVLEGAELALDAARLTGIPVVCHAAREDLLPYLTRLAPLFPLRPRLMRPWEDEPQGEDDR